MRPLVAAAVAAAILAAAVAGAACALIVGRARIRTAIAFAGLFTALAIVGNQATLFDSPHLYEWPLILAPLIAMPLGAWLIVRIKPLTPAHT